MRPIIACLICLLFLGCNQTSSKKKIKKENVASAIEVDSINTSDFKASYSVPEIPLKNPTAEELEKFEGLTKITDLKIKNVNESLFLKKFRRSLLDEILCLKFIKTASVYYDDKNPKFRFHDFYYESSFVESRFKDLLNFIDQEKKNDSQNESFRFFKRGIIIILDKKYSKISIVEFNLFGDPKFVNGVTHFFESNKNKFDGLIIILGNVNQSTIYWNE